MLHSVTDGLSRCASVDPLLSGWEPKYLFSSCHLVTGSFHLANARTCMKKKIFLSCGYKSSFSVIELVPISLFRYFYENHIRLTVMIQVDRALWLLDALYSSFCYEFEMLQTDWIILFESLYQIFILTVANLRECKAFSHGNFHDHWINLAWHACIKWEYWSRNGCGFMLQARVQEVVKIPIVDIAVPVNIKSQQKSKQPQPQPPSQPLF